jgi:hypothetical protein
MIFLLMLLKVAVMTAQGVTAEYTVEGTTFAPEGNIYDVKGNQHKLTTPLIKTAEISALCNDSKIVYNSVCPCHHMLISLTEKSIGKSLLPKRGRAYGSCSQSPGGENW